MEKKKRGSRKQKEDGQKIIDLKKPGNFIMVGVGASAGGFQPIMQMFRHIPADSGMAYAVILHLSPTHKSNLAELLQKETAMPVIQVHDPIQVEPNHVYVIPPSKDLMLEDGKIQLTEPEQARGQRVPIDMFFRSLAESYRNNAIALVLSGAGADGMLGMRRIKEEGGLTIVQDPHEAEYDDMPRNAIQAGVVDFVLSVKEIPEKLITLRENAEQIVLPPVDIMTPQEKSADPLRDILTFVRARSGHDFNNYKRSTILRRIERRLQVNEIKDVPSYLSFMRQHPDEVQALLRDLLISVTNFFRDSEAFQHLECDVVPGLLEGKKGDDEVRVWVTGCATGEEAYSLAMLLSEQAAHLTDPPKIQVFATDIAEDALNRARQGVYLETIAADVSPERLKRFFVKEGNHYRVKKDVREMVLFASHNILRDPPFSRLDLITCRNLLIYLTREIQERVLEIFHFALRPSGFLFLGSSESAEGTPSLFTPFDKKFRIYKRRPGSVAAHGVPMLPQSGRWEVRPIQTGTMRAAKPMAFGDIHRKMLIERHAPPSVLINEEGEIVHISGDAGRYLHFSEGEPSRNLLTVVHPSLRLEVRAALFNARQSNDRSESRYIRVPLNGDAPLVKIIAEPVAGEAEAAGFLVVVFDELRETTAIADEVAQRPRPEDGGMERVVRQLEEELQGTREQLRGIIEQYETSVEELRASNEELQAINEELRSTTEELETSKEELQSVNEELTTVNSELKDKIDELSRANNDMQNLMASTEIGTIFLDRNLHIKLFTPSAQRIFNIISSDLNRPLNHLTHKLNYNHLGEDAEQVLQTLRVTERELMSSDGRWYIARLLPYRTTEDRIDGVVVTFIDITERRQFMVELEEARDNLEGHVAERTAELSAEVDERRRAEYDRTQTLRTLVTALEDERRRISRELHDQLGQQLTLLKLNLETMLAQSDFVALREHIERAQATVKSIDEDLEFLAWELRPTALDELGLAAALANFVHEWVNHSGISAEFHATSMDGKRLSPEAETMLYRITQEALNNISKHAQASSVQVMLERRDDRVTLIVEDNGIGFDTNHAFVADSTRGLGLINMRERASIIDGTFDIESEPGRGTTIYVRVPFVQFHKGG